MTTRDDFRRSDWRPETHQLVAGFSVKIEKGSDAELLRVMGTGFDWRIMLDCKWIIYEEPLSFPLSVVFRRPIYVGPHYTLSTWLPDGCSVQYKCIDLEPFWRVSDEQCQRTLVSEMMVEIEKTIRDLRASGARFFPCSETSDFPFEIFLQARQS